MSLERLWVLLAKKKSGEATKGELEELKTLLADYSSSGFANEVIDRIWDAPVQSIPESKVPAKLWQRIESKTGSRNNKRIFFLRTGKWMAAAVVFLIISAAAFLFFEYAGNKQSSLHSVKLNTNQVSTQVGSKSRLKLPDGTEVWLNGNSRISYGNGSFGRDNREVVLTGEAFFDVARDEKIPFIIHTGPINITVLGTAFNIKAYPRERTIETSLVRGLVEITMTQDPERKILLKPNEKIIIPVDYSKKNPAETPTSDSAGAALYSITKLKISDKEPEEIAWINSQLMFDDEPFGQLAPKMENWYHIKIHFRNEEIKSRRFSGVIENESLKETLEAMQISYHFNYELKGNDLWIGDK